MRIVRDLAAIFGAFYIATFISPWFVLVMTIIIVVATWPVTPLTPPPDCATVGESPAGDKDVTE